MFLWLPRWRKPPSRNVWTFRWVKRVFGIPQPHPTYSPDLVLSEVGMCNQVGDARFVFEAKTIQRMELLVLTTLNWRMQAVTPFSYVDYFLNRLSGGNAALRNCLFQSAELILCAARGIQRKLLSLYHGKWYGLLCPFRVLN